MDYSEAISLLEVSPQKLEKNPPSSCGTRLLKYLFEAVTIIVFSGGEFHGCKLMTSARIIFFFFNSYSKPYNKQLNNLERSVVTGKSQTSTYRSDLAIARSIRQGLGLRLSRHDLTLGY